MPVRQRIWEAKNYDQPKINNHFKPNDDDGPRKSEKNKKMQQATLSVFKITPKAPSENVALTTEKFNDGASSNGGMRDEISFVEEKKKLKKHKQLEGVTSSAPTLNDLMIKDSPPTTFTAANTSDISAAHEQTM